ncbi:MAG: APC family permease [Candidatus Dormibacteraceae bacterium]
MGSDTGSRRGGRLPGDVRIVVGRRAKLPRTLGVPALFSACYGNVGSSIYYGLGVTAAVALGLTPLTFLIAGGIFITTALNYAEGTAAMPHAGGASSFARRAFNEPLGFLVGWVQLLNYTATVSISAYTAISYLGVFGRYTPLLASLDNPFWHAGATLALVAMLIAINVVGIQESSLLNFGLAILDLMTQVALVVLGLWLLFNFKTVIHNIHLGVAPGWGAFLASISIAMVSYTGIETISNMSEEAKSPGRTVPLATFGVIGAVMLVSAFLPSIAMSVFPVHHTAAGYTTALATTWKNDPVAGLVTFFPTWLAQAAAIWVAILAFTILIIATNAGLIGISRLSYSLSSARLFPRAFSKLHPRFKTPYVSIIVFGVIAFLLIIPAQIDLMAAVYSLAATFAFASAHLAVMRLRFVAPRLNRPYRMPFNLRFGRGSIPILSMVGALAIGAVYTELMARDIQRSSFLFVGWLGLGVLAFVIYRKATGQPLWEPLEVPPALRPESDTSPPIVAPLGERFRVGRHEHEKGEGVHAAVTPPGAAAAAAGPPLPRVERRRPPRVVRAALMVLALAIAAAAVAVDLSPLDPFGPGLGWSPGVLIVVGAAALILYRSWEERPP